MSRGVGEIVQIQEFLPDWVAPILGLLTQLGDAWFLVLLLAVLYWTRPKMQDDILLVMAMYVAGLGLYRYLKYVFEFPRPDQPLLDPEIVPWLIRPLYELTAFASSYGFPSGHATATTIVYFGLATVLTVWNRRIRYLVAGILVTIVGFTRVALGVHFLVDIIVGVALGGLLVVVTFRGIRYVTHDRTTVVLGSAILTTGLYVFESNADIEAVLALGIALGLFGGWQLVVFARELLNRRRPSQATIPLLIRGGLAVLSFTPLVVALEWFPLLGAEPFPRGALAGIAAAIAVVLPVARYSAHVSAVLIAISFWTRAVVTTTQSLIHQVIGRIRS